METSHISMGSKLVIIDQDVGQLKENVNQYAALVKKKN